jgi:hypothetical protein
MSSCCSGKDDGEDATEAVVRRRWRAKRTAVVAERRRKAISGQSPKRNGSGGGELCLGQSVATE